MPAAAAFLLILLPWLNPFSPGPTAQVGPLLFAWVCTAGVLLAGVFDRQRGENQQMVKAVVLWLVVRLATSYPATATPLGVLQASYP